MQIVPTLLCQTVEELQAGLRRWESVVEVVQLDFADGLFVPNTLPSPKDIAHLATSLKFECHLMAQQPTEWVKELLINPHVTTIIVHVESEVDIAAISKLVHQSQKLFGLAVRPETSLEIVEHQLQNIDQVLLLGVNPGFNGSPFLPSVLDKVAQLSGLWSGTIEVDGGMSPETIIQVRQAGATRVAVGSYLASGEADSQLATLTNLVA